MDVPAGRDLVPSTAQMKSHIQLQGTSTMSCNRLLSEEIRTVGNARKDTHLDTGCVNIIMVSWLRLA